MKIHWMEFENYTTGQKIERIEFDRLNLLVGESGAGKTQILKVLSNYINFAVSIKDMIPYSGHFGLGFSTEENESKYSWLISTEIVGVSYRITKEYIKKDEKFIVNRELDKLYIDDKEVPNISFEPSAISIFSNHKLLNSVKQEFYKFIYNLNYDSNFTKLSSEKMINYRQLHKGTDIIFMQTYGTKLPLLIKLDTVKYCQNDLYAHFVEDVQNIFPQIQDISVEIEDETGLFNLFILQDGKKIPAEDISAGMLKTIYIVASIDFALPGTIFCIDELENALGVNCLDEITDYICDSAIEKNIQFILTSHHPYIISHIPQDNWRIISQKNGVISSKRAAEVGIDDSYGKQERFFKLINYMQRQSS